MLASSAAATLSLQGHEYEYSWTVQMDLPGGIFPDVTLALSYVDIEASTTTDQPDGTRLQDGSARQQAKFTLAGPVNAADRTQDAAWLFGRYSTSSPLWPQPVFKRAVRIYFKVATAGSAGTPETFRRFTGYVDSYVQADDGSVQFTCLDGRQLLRSVPDIPAVATAPPFNASLTAEFAVDGLLRTATNGALSSWPAQPAGCVLSVGMRSSVTPELGTLLGSLPGSPTFVPGAHGSALMMGNSAFAPEYMLASAVTTAFSMRCWFSTHIGSLGVNGNTVSFVVAGTGDSIGVYANNDGTVTVQTGNSAANVATGFGAGFHLLEVAATLPAVGSSGGTGTVWLDGVAYSFTATGGTRASVSYNGVAEFGVSGYGPGATVEGFAFANNAALSTLGAAWTPSALIDASLNPLQVVPEMSGDPWQVIQQIAVAELAVARFDESTGKFLYLNRRTIAQTPVARTVSCTSSLVTVGGIESTFASIVTDANVGYTSYSFATLADGVTPKITEVYASNGPHKIPARGSASWTITLGSFAVVNLDTSPQNLPNGSTDGGGVGSVLAHSRFRASVDRYGSSEFGGTLSWVFTQPSANQITVTVSNPTKQDAFLVSPANYTDLPPGTPLFWLGGQVVTQNVEQTVNAQWPPLNPDGSGGAASSQYGDVAWSGTGNPWSQDPDAAAQLASDVIVSNCLPLPNFTGLSIVPDPRIQLTDKLLIDDSARSGVVEFVQVFGYTITWQAGVAGEGVEFDMSIDGRVIVSPGGGLIGYGSDVTSFAGRNVIGTGSTPGSLYIAA